MFPIRWNDLTKYGIDIIKNTADSIIGNLVPVRARVAYIPKSSACGISWDAKYFLSMEKKTRIFTS